MLSDKTVKVPSKSGTQVFLTLKSRIFLLQLTSQLKNVQMYINLSKYLMNAYCVSDNLGVIIQRSEKMKHGPHSNGACGEQLNRGDVQGASKRCNRVM